MDRARFEVHLNGDMTVGGAITELVSKYPALAIRLVNAVFVVGGQPVDRHAALREGDEIAILLAIAGGI